MSARADSEGDSDADSEGGRESGSEASGQASQDPTGTVTLRQDFRGAFSSRWRDLRGAIRQTVDRNDALRLQAGPHPTTGTSAGQYSGRPVQDFGVDDDASRQAEWAAWFPTALDRYVLDSAPPQRIQNGEHYSATYLRRAYSRGLALANRDARQHDLAPITTTADEGDDADDTPTLSDPPDLISNDTHQEALDGAQLATYEDVQRAVDETRTVVSRTLGEGLAAGWGVREMGDALTGRVEAVGQTRTVTIAITRTVDTVNEAILTRAEELGASEVGVIPETVPDDDDADGDGDGGDETDARWVTAQDSRVCPQCRSLSGNTYSIEAVRRGDAPRPIRDTHSNCRCRLVVVG